MTRKVALVSGASRGIGAAIARTLAKDGFDLALTCVNRRTAADELAEELRSYGAQAWVAQFDVRDAAASKVAIETLLAATPIHVVVNNAGVSKDGPFPGLSVEAWHSVVDTTLDGFFHITQPLVMPMVRRKWGRIINISSISGVIGNRGQVNYAAAKAGLIGATKALALELASRNITVNAVAPGLIDTEMIVGSPIEEILKHIPMKRVGTAQEVADLVSYLASDKSAYMTGQVIAISGGL
ncbi:MAG TPA: 3-oxoacyl-ACP reductase FabG [Kofleriaceae bacterium]|nr:3-oxoacyl-ACP reductase FabG [Kofleriaceae bacterium]